MGLVHNEGMKPFLPQVATALVAKVDQPRILTVCFTESGAQTVFRRRDQDQMNMVRHQTIGQNLRSGIVAALLQKSKIGAIVVITGKDIHAPHTTLGHVMRKPGNHKSSQSCHDDMMSVSHQHVN